MLLSLRFTARALSYRRLRGMPFAWSTEKAAYQRTCLGYARRIPFARGHSSVRFRNSAAYGDQSAMSHISLLDAKNTKEELTDFHFFVNKMLSHVAVLSEHLLCSFTKCR